MLHRGKTLSKTFVWQFDFRPDAVWAALADTARFNEAAGLPKHRVRTVTEGDGNVRYLTGARFGAFALAWEEIPIEWVSNRWLRHERRFLKGPLSRLTATIRLSGRSDGGTECGYTLEATAGTLLGRLLLPRLIAGSERSFGRLAEAVRQWAAGRTTVPYPVPPYRPSAAMLTRARQCVEEVEASGYGHGRAAALLEWLLTASELDLARIRPLRLAPVLGLGWREGTELCLQAVRSGLLELRWDVLCPRCRGAQATSPSLETVEPVAHCSSCNVDYEADFSRNIEATFHPAAWLRQVDDGEFCLFGPMSTPHVVAQAGLDPGETRELPLGLAPGSYRIRTLDAGPVHDFGVNGRGLHARLEGGAFVGKPAAPGTVVLENGDRRHRVLLVESRAWQAEALTAHRMTTLQRFRDLFPSQGLRPGTEAPISQVSLMFTDIVSSTAFYERVGDSRAYGVVREHFGYIGGIVRRHNGSVVKTIGDAVMAAFANPDDALRAALDIQGEIAAFNRDRPAAELAIKLGVHAGPCVAVTMNERLDYFGSTVNLAARLGAHSQGGDIVLSRQLADNPIVVPVLAGRPVETGAYRPKGFGAPIAFVRVLPAA